MDRRLLGNLFHLTRGWPVKFLRVGEIFLKQTRQIFHQRPLVSLGCSIVGHRKWNLRYAKEDDSSMCIVCMLPFVIVRSTLPVDGRFSNNSNLRYMQFLTNNTIESVAHCL